MSWLRKVVKKPRPRASLDNWRAWHDNHWVASEIVKRWHEEDLPAPLLGPGCKRCGSDGVVLATVWFAQGSGMSPICQDCWDVLGTVEARLPYFRSLWWRWEMDAAFLDCPYGNHSHGRDPFWSGHYHPSWDQISQAVEDYSNGIDRFHPGPWWNADRRE